ncbi:MAG: transferase, partial [Eubacterium sp.]
IHRTLKKLEKSFKVSANKYYKKNNEAFFSPYHSGQYAIFLFYLASLLHQNRKIEIATQVYYLNKIMNSVDWYFELNLPDIFGVEHPLGSVMGRARYSDYFFFYQGCTVGGNKGKYPTIGKNVTMFSNSSILGESYVGEHVVISTGTLIKDENIPDYSLVFGQSPELIIKQKDKEYMIHMSQQFWNKEYNG